MQNSGLGNIVNPVLSLADAEVYGIPMVLLIGWRGEPGVRDEPQHQKQGRVTTGLLDAMEIPYSVLESGTKSVKLLVKEVANSAARRHSPHAILVRRGSFSPYVSRCSGSSAYEVSRESAIRSLVQALGESDIVVATTGMASRELFEYRTQLQSECHDFLTVGGMGHASQVALGVAAQRSDRRVICIDGDGAALMHLGSMAICGSSKLSNFVHVILNNGAHDSVGGQATVGFQIDFVGIAQACNYKRAVRCDSLEGFRSNLDEFLNADGDGPVAIEMRIAKGSRDDLGRPTSTPQDNRDEFMKFLEK
jgi:phosphonopyruvate decarboxylase